MYVPKTMTGAPAQQMPLALMNIADVQE